MSLAEALRLIVITDEELAQPRAAEDVVAEALRAGVRAIQLRNKKAGARGLHAQALRLRRLTREWGALLFINDRFDVALASGADGIHVGPQDLPVGDLRAVAPTGFLIGASTDEPDVAKGLQEQGADYIGCGAVFPTSTKKDAGEVIGVRGLEEVVRAVEIPVVGIGGVTPEGAVQIANESRAAGVAVIGSVMAADDPGAAAQALMAAIEAVTAGHTFTPDLGGSATTKEFTEAVLSELNGSPGV
jgi:thiamine-phosphate pyrophosphorylase